MVIANMSNGDTFTIGSTVYTAGSIVNDPGEFSNIGTDASCRDALMNEINGNGIGPAHPDVIASAGSGSALILTALVGGEAGNSITVASSDETAWSASFADNLSGGGVSTPSAPSTITLTAASQPAAPGVITPS